MFACACVCVRVCVRACVCVRVCVRVPTGAHGSSRTNSSTFGNVVTSLTFVDANGNLHSTLDVSPFVGSNGLYGVITQMAIKVCAAGKAPDLRRMHPARGLHHSPIIKGLPYGTAPGYKVYLQGGSATSA